MRLTNFLTAPLILLAGQVAAAAAGLKDIKVQLVTTDGSVDQSYDIPPSSPLSQPLTLLPDHILRLTFDLPSPSSTPPKFIHIEFEDLETGESVTYEAPGGGKGKGKDKDKGRVDLKTSSLPSALRRTSGHLSLTLHTPTQPSQPLLTLHLPSTVLSPPTPHRHDPINRKGQNDPVWRRQEEIEWAFREGEKEVGVVGVSLGMGVVLGSVGLLVVLLLKSLPSTTATAAPSSAYVFIGTLIGLEGLIVRYWVGGRIYTFLPPFLLLSALSAYIGKTALRSIQLRRLGLVGQEGVKRGASLAGATAVQGKSSSVEVK